MEYKLKVVFLHPPLYPINHDFFNFLGKYVDLIIYNIGEYPKFHPKWKSIKYINQKNNYNIKFFGKGFINLKIQLNPIIYLNLLKDKPDIVISIAFWLPSLFGLIFKYFFNYKFLILTDAIYETDKNISFLKKIYRKSLLNFSDGVISSSKLTTQYLRTLTDNKIYESFYTLNLKKWKKNLNDLPSKKNLRKELNLPFDKTILLGVGNLIDKKNWIFVLENIKNINDIYFILVGDGENKNKINDFIKNNNLQDKVLLTGRKEGIRLLKYFKVSDIFIFPSLYDQFGFVVIEALASGLPILCNENSGASSLIENGKNGFIINPQKNFLRELNIIKNDLSSFKENIDFNYSMEKKAKDFYIKLKDTYYD